MIAALPTIIGVGFPVIALVLCLVSTVTLARAILGSTAERRVPVGPSVDAADRSSLDGLRVVTSLTTAVLFVLFARQFGSWHIVGNVGWYVTMVALAVAAGGSVLALGRLPFTQPHLRRGVLVGRWANAVVSVAVAVAVGAGVLLV